MRNRSLDVLRAVAALAVVAAHADPKQIEALPWGNAFFQFWIRSGWAGVDLFFVLSGFLVSGLIFREWQSTGQLRLGRFLVRRAFRIYPPFYACLGFSALYAWYAHRLPTGAVIRDALFIQNYTVGYLDHTWSLAVEEHFYLLLAAGFFLTLYLSKKTDFRALPTIFLIIAMTLVGLRIWTYEQIPFSHRTHVYPTHLRLDALFFGVLLAYADRYRRESWIPFFSQNAKWLFGAAAVLLLPLLFCDLNTSWYLPTFGFTTNYLGFGLVLLAVCHGDFSRLPRALSVVSAPLVRGLSFLGRRSYSIYLWHVPIKWWGIRSIETHTGLTFSGAGYLVLYFSASLLIGCLMGAAIEEPALKMRDRWFSRESTKNSPDALPVAA
jgi:peptidoglycan/LPS O-acetylase OafA/YrhL